MKVFCQRPSACSCWKSKSFALYYRMVRLFFSLTVISIVIVSIWSFDGLTVHNSLLKHHVFKTFVSIDWLQCVEECQKREMCFSYNFFRPGKICELNNFSSVNRCEGNNLISANGWIHHVLETLQVKYHDLHKHEM